MKKHLLITIAAFCFSSVWTHAAGLQMTPTLDYVWISGTRAYDASGHNENHNRTSGRLSPGLSFSYQVSSDWFVGASYRYLHDIDGSGVSGSADVFNTGQPSATVLTYYNYTETIHQWSLNGGYSTMLSETVSFRVGPTLDFNVSNADFTIKNFTGIEVAGSGPTRSFSANDLTLGAFMNIAFKLSDQWSLGASYRYSSPPKRNLNSLGVTLSCSF